MAPSLVLAACCLVAEPPDGFVPPGSAKEIPRPPVAEPKEEEKPTKDPADAEKASGDREAEKKSDKKADEEPASGPLVPVQHRTTRKLPELVLDEVLDADGGPASGRTVSLFDALQRSGNRAARTDLVKAYWAHVTAIGNQRVHQDALARIERVENEASGRSEGAAVAELAAAAASARARLREAQLARQETRHRLATYLGDANVQVVPADLPHVGGYRTAFDQVFAKRTPPAELRMLHRTLPLLQACIKARSEAVRAGKEALEAADAVHRQEDMTAGQWLHHLAVYRGQRLAFLREVQQYNTQIADYAEGVAGKNGDARSFVALLIQTGDTPSPGRLLPQPQAKPKTPAKFVPSRDVRPVGGSGPSRPAPTAKGREKSILRSSTKLPPGKYDPDVRPAEFRQATPSKKPKQHSRYYRGAATPGDASRRRFAALANLPREQQPQRLAAMLYGSRTNPLEVTVRQATLSECLRGITATSDRRRVVDAYLLAGERASRFAAAAARRDQIETIQAGEAKSLEQVASYAKQSAAGADLQRARAELVAQCFRLTIAAGRPTKEAWLWPSTLPRAGRVAVGQPLLGPSAISKHQQAILAGCFDLLLQQTAAVIAADKARAAVQHLVAQGRGSLIDAHRCIDHEHRETLRFLGALTRYNLAHADATQAAPAPNLRQGDLGRRLLGWVGFER